MSFDTIIAIIGLFIIAFFLWLVVMLNMMRFMQLPWNITFCTMVGKYT